MPEEQNIEQSLEDGKTGSPEEVNENISPDQTITLAELSNQTSEIPKSEIKEMEVHHHPHVEKKNFKEYFLEFLMIFLAVTLGFIAENIREHIIENERVHQYAALLVADLKRDTAFFNTANERWLQQQSHFDRLIKTLIRPEPASDTEVLQQLFDINYVSDAKINTATYNQMKASGSLRYITNIKLTMALEEYSETELSHVTETAQSTMAFFNDYIKTFFIDHLRNQDMLYDTTSMENWHPVILGRNKETDQRLSNIINMDRTQQRIFNRYLNTANKKAKELIEMISKEYNLK